MRTQFPLVWVVVEVCIMVNQNVPGIKMYHVELKYRDGWVYSLLVYFVMHATISIFPYSQRSGTYTNERSC